MTTRIGGVRHAGLRLATGLTRFVTGGLACAAAVTLVGCTQRTIEVTSEPPGALVWINDNEVGRTPLETDFKFFGTYDVRVKLDGYEPVHTGMLADAPLHEQPGLDLLLAPADLKTTVRWHFTLVASPEAGDKRAAQDGAVERAKAFREQSQK